MKKFLTVLFCSLVLSVGMFANGVVGTWNYNYDWGCSGGYASTTITFNNDGTFSDGFGSTGKWYKVGCYVIWEYTNNTTYAGNLIGGAMMGMMATTWNNSKGCWYCTKTTWKKIMKMEVAVDASGKKIIKKKK